MKRTLGFFAFILLLGSFSYYIFKKELLFSISPRGIVSRIIPPSKDVKQFLPQTSENTTPFVIPNGYSMDVFADLKGNLPRVLTFDPSGVLVVSTPNTGKIFALLDTDSNKKTDQLVEVLSGLNKPHGIVFDNGYLYVAETNAVSRYVYDPGSYTASGRELLFNLPGGGRHSTRTIKINNSKLYTSVGSSCDVCLESNWMRASILVSNLDGSELKTFATGLRNTVFFTFDREGKIWGNDMGRDNLGDDLPPDELNIISDGKDYGWPYCFGDRVRDNQFRSNQNRLSCTDTQPPLHSYPAHVAPLGITFDKTGSLLVAYHGSWNSTEPVGYKIVKFDIFADSVGSQTDFVKGFINRTEVLGRPVDLAFDEKENLFISDDHTGVVYILYP